MSAKSTSDTNSTTAGKGWFLAFRQAVPCGERKLTIGLRSKDGQEAIIEAKERLDRQKRIVTSSWERENSETPDNLITDAHVFFRIDI